MNNTTTKKKTKIAARPAIERIVASGSPSVLVDQCRVELENASGFDYFLVNTDDFAPLVARGSVLNVCTDIDGAAEPTPTELVLVAANNRLEIRTGAKSKGTQFIGSIWEIRRWPGMDLERPY